MTTHFTVRELSASGLPRVLPLLDLVCDGAEIGAWRRHADASAAAGAGRQFGSGTVVAEDGRGYVTGLFCYRVGFERPTGRILSCVKFVVPDLVRSSATFDQLVERAETIARDHDCRRLRIALCFLPEPFEADDDRFAGRLQRRGFAFECVQYAKEIADAGRSGHRPKERQT